MVRSLVTTVSLAIVAVVLAVAAADAAPIYVYGNLGSVANNTTSNTVGYLSPTQTDQSQAQGFSVGNQVGSSAWEIKEIQVGLGSTGNPSPVVAIYSNVASAPGSLLATFTNSTPVDTKAIYTFTGSFTAVQNTSYWAVLSNANSASLESYEWYAVDGFSTPSEKNASNITYLGTLERSGTGAWSSALPSLSIGVNAVSAVPEPSTYALAVVAGVLGACKAARRRDTQA